MNYLAHLALANHSPASLMGNLLGDFAKGTRAHLESVYESELVDGLMMHRAIDQFTDQHPAFLEAKRFINPSRRRLGGIAIDIFFDHFLSQTWNAYHAEPLDDFIQRCYNTIDNHPHWWVGEFNSAYFHMKHEDWLRCYHHKEGVQLTLERISQRNRKWIKPIASCYEDFLNHYNDFKRCFEHLYPDLMRYSQAYSSKNGL